ncbi:Rha family transcriptional regulator [Deinococcus enclensis]|uniref:Phage regulatory protein Rha (Phage_pRha) n=1 Tax=Deinococcus enclensis TaxID=1049582 RepID=A0ABT9ME64_9DEIO|nr:Rha family transcriptional regulator [Deinococcus enclensis]MDP9764908.1 hypothetical protein [Deinococcus enclensis]
MEIVAAPDTKGELRMDSRALAERMDNQHASIVKLIDRNLGHFERFGGVGFEIQTLETKGGKQESRCAYLNEDQCYFLLTLVRNNDKTVPMKADVVAAFAKARALAQCVTERYAPALISARGVAAGLGCSAKSAMNRLSYRQIQPTHHCFEPVCGAPTFLFPLEEVEAVWPAGQFEPHRGEALPGTAPVRQAITASASGKIARQHRPRLLPTDTSTEQLARRLLSLEAQKRAVLKELAALA